ncbi:hypothetical protein [Enterocloster sp.]|uniref:hypothetical protein n=1 Tax=Enterocloster sp. TaxID=2719315 RepID=UPI0039A3F096
MKEKARAAGKRQGKGRKRQGKTCPAGYAPWILSRKTIYSFGNNDEHINDLKLIIDKMHTWSYYMIYNNKSETIK